MYAMHQWMNICIVPWMNVIWICICTHAYHVYSSMHVMYECHVYIHACMCVWNTCRSSYVCIIIKLKNLEKWMYAMYQWKNVYPVGLNVIFMNACMPCMHMQKLLCNAQICTYEWAAVAWVRAWVRESVCVQSFNVFLFFKNWKIENTLNIHSLARTNARAHTSIQARAWRHAHAKLVMWPVVATNLARNRFVSPPLEGFVKRDEPERFSSCWYKFGEEWALRLSSARKSIRTWRAWTFLKLSLPI